MLESEVEPVITPETPVVRPQSIDAYGQTHQQVDEFNRKITEAFDLPQQGRIIDAFNLMVEVHEGQTRLDGSPYSTHPLGVAINVFNNMAQKVADLIIAAFLHDAVEDHALKLAKKTGLSRRKSVREKALSFIKQEYGLRVAEIVTALSKPDFDAVLMEKGITRENPDYSKRKNELYRDHVEKTIENSDVALIKYFDFAANAFTLNELPDGPQKTNFLDKYAQVVDIFIARLMDDTSPLNISPERRRQMLDDLNKAKKEMETMLHGVADVAMRINY